METNNERDTLPDNSSFESRGGARGNAKINNGNEPNKSNSQRTGASGSMVKGEADVRLQTRDRQSSPATLVNENDYRAGTTHLTNSVVNRSHDRSFTKILRGGMAAPGADVGPYNNGRGIEQADKTFTDAQRKTGKFGSDLIVSKVEKDEAPSRTRTLQGHMS